MDTAENIAAANMAFHASATKDLLVQALRPKTYRKGDDVEKFIIECRKYFDAANVTKSTRELVIVGLLDDKLRSRFEKTDEGLGYEERLRRLFVKEKSFIKDIESVLSYKRQEEDVDSFVEEIDKMVELLMTYNDKEEMRKELLMHCCNSSEIKKNVAIQNIKDSEGIITLIRSLDKVEDKEPIYAMRPSYRGALMNNKQQRNTFKQREDYPINRNPRPIREIICYGCNKPGHIRRDCPVTPIRECFGCGSTEHIRRFCTKIKCQRCTLNGHRANECRTSEGRIQLIKRQAEYDKGRLGDKRLPHNRKSAQNETSRRNNERNTIDTVREESPNREIYEYEYDDDDRVGKEYNESKYPNGRAPSEDEMIGALY